MQFDHIWFNARIATCAENMPGIGIIDDGVLACRDGRILFVGSAHDAPKDFDSAGVTDCENRWLTPGLIDCHTHLVHGGDRALEFEMRLAGASYEAISRAGGGIFSTVNATRTTSSAQLLKQALRRIDAMIAEGVTTVEIKSGYGLDLTNEVKQLRIAKSIGNLRAMEVCPTFLGAHALPPEAISADAYIDSVCDVMIPAIATAKLATAVDAFCEGIGFTAGQVARVFDAADRHGLRVKLHADQLSNLEGAALASRYNALSADHLEYTSATGVQAMAAAGVVSVLLPGAYYFMRETQLPPIVGLREARVAMAIATDCNPGTSPLTSILTAMNMAATLFRMTTDECLLGVTRHAAAALGRSGDIGSLEVGKLANLAIWQINRPAELTYRIGYNPLHDRVFLGKTDGK